MVCPHDACVGSQLNIFLPWNENAMASVRISRQIHFQKGETRDHSWRLAQIYFQQCYWKNSSYWHTRWSIRSWKRSCRPYGSCLWNWKCFFCFLFCMFLVGHACEVLKSGFLICRRSLLILICWSANQQGKTILLDKINIFAMICQLIFQELPGRHFPKCCWCLNLCDIYWKNWHLVIFSPGLHSSICILILWNKNTVWNDINYY